MQVCFDVKKMKNKFKEQLLLPAVSFCLIDAVLQVQTSSLLSLLPSFDKLRIKGRCCITKPSRISATSASISFSFPERERAVLHCKSPSDPVVRGGKLHIYHIVFISLLNIFKDSENFGIVERRGLCVVPLLRRG